MSVLDYVSVCFQHVCMCSESDIYSGVFQNKPITSLRLYLFDHEHHSSPISLPLLPYISAPISIKKLQ